MAHGYPKTARHCGTCRYWTGCRSDRGGDYYVTNTRDTGTCQKSGNIRCGKEMMAYESCTQWTKV